jgi:hypothetical protein
LLSACDKVRRQNRLIEIVAEPQPSSPVVDPGLRVFSPDPLPSSPGTRQRRDHGESAPPAAVWGV